MVFIYIYAMMFRNNIKCQMEFIAENGRLHPMILCLDTKQ